MELEHGWVCSKTLYTSKLLVEYDYAHSWIRGYGNEQSRILCWLCTPSCQRFCLPVHSWSSRKDACGTLPEGSNEGLEICEQADRVDMVLYLKVRTLFTRKFEHLHEGLNKKLQSGSHPPAPVSSIR